MEVFVRSVSGPGDSRHKNSEEVLAIDFHNPMIVSNTGVFQNVRSKEMYLAK